MKIEPGIVKAIATVGYVGYMPVAPGTSGSLVGLLIYLIMPFYPLAVVVLGVIGFIVFAMWIAGEAEKLLSTKDPGCIVIDEVAGMAVTFVGIPASVYLGVAGFFIFRFFDIVKPFPIKYLEKKCPGGIGVVIDDVIAGLLSNLVIHVLMLVF